MLSHIINFSKYAFWRIAIHKSTNLWHGKIIDEGETKWSCRWIFSCLLLLFGFLTIIIPLLQILGDGDLWKISQEKDGITKGGLRPKYGIIVFVYWHQWWFIYLRSPSTKWQWMIVKWKLKNLLQYLYLIKSLASFLMWLYEMSHHKLLAVHNFFLILHFSLNFILLYATCFGVWERSYKDHTSRVIL